MFDGDDRRGKGRGKEMARKDELTRAGGGRSMNVKGEETGWQMKRDGRCVFEKLWGRATG